MREALACQDWNACHWPQPGAWTSSSELGGRLGCLQSWLVMGPDMAKVTKVETVDLEYHTEFKDFKIG